MKTLRKVRLLTGVGYGLLLFLLLLTVSACEATGSDEVIIEPTAEIPEMPLSTVMVEETPGEATPAGTAQIYLVALEDAGQSGQEIGCNDSLIAVEPPGSPTTLSDTMAALLTIHEQFYGQSDLYNALYQSDLQVESAEIDESGTAVVYLSGEYALGGTCDTPRFEAQLQETARQFSTNGEVAIFINDRPLEEVLSVTGQAREPLYSIVL